MEQGNLLEELQSADNQQFMEKLVDFFNQKGSLQLSHGSKNSREKKKTLLGLDNAEELMTSKDEKQYFR